MEQTTTTFTLPGHGEFTLPIRPKGGIQTAAGSTSVTGREAQAIYAILTLRGALKLETKGLRASRGFSAGNTVKKVWGFKGSKERLLEQLNDWIEKNIQRD